MRRFVFRLERLCPLFVICLLVLVVFFLVYHVGRSPMADLQKNLGLKLSQSISRKIPSVSNVSLNKTIGLREQIEQKLSRNLARSTRVKPRKNMGECPTIYGKVGVYVAVDNSSYNLTTRYTVAQKSLRCYLKSTNYSFFYINVDTDPRTLAECKQKELHILRTVLPEATEEVGACEAIYREAKSFETYLKYVTCVKYTLGAVRVFPGVARIYRRGHSFVRDYQITNSYYGPNDFMMHGWKPSKVNVNDGGYEISVFKKMPDLEKCGTGGLNGWYFNPRYAISTEDIKLQLAAYERQTQQWFPKEARYLPFLIKAETANCYPNCDALT
ncbi:hypothetical protein M3Y96_00366800 [Aphelenchoides besseyi]|nr:hypothetical protein M3Y96_00366800 [Aphelenchoides besseyi]